VAVNKELERIGKVTAVV